MRTLEQLEEAVGLAEKLGFKVRHEWLGGEGGGSCEFGGQKWLFVDLALTTYEQLEQVIEALAADAPLAWSQFPSSLQAVIRDRRAA